MTFKDYIIVMAVATVAAWAGWIVVLVAIDPSASGVLGFLFFYATLAASLLGTLSILGAILRSWIRPQELVSRHVSRSFRQAVFLSVLFIGSLILLSEGLFTWWVMLLLILALALLELVFLSAQRPRNAVS